MVGVALGFELSFELSDLELSDFELSDLAPSDLEPSDDDVVPAESLELALSLLSEELSPSFLPPLSALGLLFLA